MKRFLLAVSLATLAMYAWGMIYWGFSGILPRVWKQSEDDAAAQAALGEYFPENGTYYVPATAHDLETAGPLHEVGPVAMVHMTAVDGRPAQSMKPLCWGFVLVVITTTLMAAALTMAAPALPHYTQRLRLVALFAAAAVIAIHAGDAVWWFLPSEWKLTQGVYDLTSWLIGGAILAAFIKPPASFDG